jgi:hypothetical protein
MTEELVLVIESGDEVGAVEHVSSMAENGAKVKRWWTLAQVSQLVEHLRFTHQHTVDLGCFVSLAFA